MSSRKASMDVSRTYDNGDDTMANNNNSGKSIQVVSDPSERDPEQIENNPGAFCAEQTWPTSEELK